MQSNQSESLLSRLSNISYRQPQKLYSGTQFFKQSLPGGFDHKIFRAENNQRQVDIDSLGNSSAFKCYQDCKDHVRHDTVYWTSDPLQNIEGTSDNQQIEKQVEPQSQFVKEQVRESESESIKNQISHSQESSPIIKEQQNLDVSSSNRDDKMIKNQTKNIPKNYGKAIIIFIQKNAQMLAPLMEQYNVNHLDMMSKLKSLKRKINTIADLRNLWSQESQSQCLRVISNFFLRKHSLHYIYNSRIRTRMCHVKYKKRLQEAIGNPFQFNHIKDY